MASYNPPAGNNVDFFFQLGYIAPSGDNINFNFIGGIEMAMYTAIIKNTGASDVTIEDLGITIAAGSQEDLHEQYDFPLLAGSDDLRTAINNGDLVINDGSGDLSAADGVLYFILVTRKYLTDNHFTKTQLSTSGQSTVHWDNITNTPSFANPKWSGSVTYRVSGVDLGAAPGTPIDGMVYVDNQATPHYWRYEINTWVDKGAVVDGDEIIDLTNATQNIFKFVVGTGWVDQGLAEDNVSIIVNDDGTDYALAKGAHYIFSTEAANTWVRVGALDFSGHLDGGVNKHDASEIDVEGNYTNINTNNVDLETAISNINTAIGDIQTGNSQTKIVGGEYYTLDTTRGDKWLSARQTVVFGRRGASRNQYLNYGAGNLTSNNSGLRCMKDITITGMSVQLDSSGSCDVHVRKNDTTANIATCSVSAAAGNALSTLNVDVSAGEFLQAFLTATTRVADPVVMVEFAYRTA